MALGSTDPSGRINSDPYEFTCLCFHRSFITRLSQHSWLFMWLLRVEFRFLHFCVFHLFFLSSFHANYLFLLPPSPPFLLLSFLLTSSFLPSFLVSILLQSFLLSSILQWFHSSFFSPSSFLHPSFLPHVSQICLELFRCQRMILNFCTSCFYQVCITMRSVCDTGDGIQVMHARPTLYQLSYSTNFVLSSGSFSLFLWGSVIHFLSPSLMSSSPTSSS